MEKDFIKKFINIAENHSPKCFVNKNNELIIEPKNNIYFRLEDIETELELKCKVIAWLSRPSHTGVSTYWQKRIRTIVNDFLNTRFTVDEMELIYGELGNDCDRNKSIEFIESNYDFSELLSSQFK